MSLMSIDINRDPDLEWLDHVRPVGLVVAASLLKELGLAPTRQTLIDTAAVAEQIDVDGDGPALRDVWGFMRSVLGWEGRHVAGAPGGPDIDQALVVALPEHGTTLQPTWAVRELGSGGGWQLLVRVEAVGVDPDRRGGLDGWEATPQQRFERLLRDTGVFAGLMITDSAVRLIFAPRGETSGHLTFPIRPLATVAGRPMLGGLKLLLGSFRLFNDADTRRLPALLRKSRDAQASVSTELSGQVLGALHELLRGFDAAEPDLIRDLAARRPDHLYEGLLTVLMRLVFILYAEDRDLLPSRADGRAREVYETSYSVRGLYARLTEDAAFNPDTMDERKGGWGRLLALFRLIYAGHATGFVQGRGGKLFNPDEFPFLEGRASMDEAPRVPAISDGCLLRVVEGLMTLKLRGGVRERLSYRTLDVEQIGSVYETVMGFTVQPATGPSLAIKAGKNNRTPVFVNLEALSALKGKARLKHLKEEVGRSLSTAQAKPVEDAETADDLASALGNLVDERASPRQAITPAGLPILQPTDERRRTGSHYTPRSLTAPIVLHALAPAFARLGENATPEQVLELKVCDPAMGSAAFLVEACRQLGERLVSAWGRHPAARPAIPADEDEELHARRLVAQRCLYGVDRNPRAVDLARLSLWLSTLARDHEFSFLDHALKCGDSLVGLSQAQIRAAHWDASKPGLPLFRQLVEQRVNEAVAGREAIRQAPDDELRAVQEARHWATEGRLDPVRTVGDAVVAAFFAGDKPRKREEKRVAVEQHITGALTIDLAGLEVEASALRAGEHGVRPFHWGVEFPEVFARENPGFDAIVGNPPFLGGSRISTGYGGEYLAWLLDQNKGAHGLADLVAHFFRRAFDLLRNGGVFGLIATNTISQGDTRSSSLRVLLKAGGNITNAIRRYRWPGEAAVIVSVLHVLKGEASSARLDGRVVRRVSAYLVEGDFDDDPQRLSENAGRSFIGSKIYGQGFLFDDTDTKANPVSVRDGILEEAPISAKVIHAYLGGEEVNNDPRHLNNRWVFDFEAMSLSEVESVFPELLEIARSRVKPERDKNKRGARRDRWWLFGDRQPGLYKALAGRRQIFVVNAGAAPHFAIASVPANQVFAHSLSVLVLEGGGPFAVLQSRAHELWARFFASSMKDDLRYTPSDCFRTFPFPPDYETAPALELAGETYHAHRAELMVNRNEGLTKTYNRFHARSEKGADIARLRQLHTEMDQAVLRAYGWKDLAERAAPQFIEQDADEGKTPKTRLDWSSEFKDQLLARLLALNAERAAAEKAAGLTAVSEDDADEDGEEVEEAKGSLI